MPRRILIVDDVATNRIVMKVKLSEACYEVLQADGGQAAIDIARAERPDLILLDLVMPDLDGISVCRQLKSDPETADIPVIMVTASHDSDGKIRALEAGAEEFLTKPLDEVLLLARVRSLLRARETARELDLRDGTRRALGFGEASARFTLAATIALVAEFPDIAKLWATRLQSHLSANVITLTRAEALALNDTDQAPDVFVVADDLAPPGSGLRLLTDLRSRAPTRHSAVVIAMAEGARDAAAMALDLGANDLFIGAFEPAELALRLTTQLTRKQQADRLRASVEDGLRMAVTDPLTGLFNRRYALPHLARIAERAAESNRSFAVMLLDLDRFKMVNDRHGHAGGDAVLVEVAKRLTGNLRPVDLISRIGGEEFLVVLPDTPLAEARLAAERLRKQINRRPVTLPYDAGEICITASIGLAICTGKNSTAEDLLSLADKALYAAKAQGRNTVTVSRSAA